MEAKTVYHGSRAIVQFPEIRIAKYHKDFYYGFYCTEIKQQAERWASRMGKVGYVNVYTYRENPELKSLKFEKMTEEWLDFIVACRMGVPHDYDIVEGPMANDTIFNYIQNFADGKISRVAFWELAKFQYPTHQMSFHTARALETLKFVKGESVHGEK